MKYIAIMLAISGCATTTSRNQTPEVISHNSPQITVGQNDNVMWKCQKDAVSENSIWVDCSFKNGSRFSQATCINVYFDHDHTFVLANNKTCSGTIPPGAVVESHAAFIRDRRISVNALCGENLSGCKLNSVERFEPQP